MRSKRLLLFVMMCLIHLTAKAQLYQIKGLVQDEQQGPLAGVSIYVKSDLKIATISDSQGNFNLEVPSYRAYYSIWSPS